MMERAVTNVLENMLCLHERSLTDPVRPFGPHMGKGFRLPVHPLNHVMTADPGHRPASLRHFGRGIMRAAGTEIGRPLHQRVDALQ